LPTRPVEDVDQMRLQVEQPKLKHGKKPNRARPDDCDIRLDPAHCPIQHFQFV
jgi:hypothetical protein